MAAQLTHIQHILDKPKNQLYGIYPLIKPLNLIGLPIHPPPTLVIEDTKKASWDPILDIPIIVLKLIFNLFRVASDSWQQNSSIEIDRSIHFLRIN